MIYEGITLLTELYQSEIVYLIMLLLLIRLIHFKNRLDKFWEHQGVLSNYRANITGIGNRSIVVD